MLRAPGQLGLGRAYVAGALDVDDIDEVAGAARRLRRRRRSTRGTKARLGRGGGARRRRSRRLPRAPAAELRPQGRRHSIARDKRAVTPPLRRLERLLRALPRRVDDVLVRGSGRAAPRRSRRRRDQARARLHEARAAGRASACSTSAAAGARFAMHAAREHGVHVTGITLSEPQAARARERARPRRASPTASTSGSWTTASCAARRFDAIASIGMVEHVGERQHRRLRAHARRRCSSPGGRLLNHGIARLRHGEAEAGPFSERYVFPDAAPLHLSRDPARARARGLRDRARRGLPARTTRARCASGRGGSRPTTTRRVRLAGPERVRVWQVYLRAARRGFETGFTSVYQVRARKT